MSDLEASANYDEEGDAFNESAAFSEGQGDEEQTEQEPEAEEEAVEEQEDEEEAGEEAADGDTSGSPMQQSAEAPAAPAGDSREEAEEGEEGAEQGAVGALHGSRQEGDTGMPPRTASVREDDGAAGTSMQGTGMLSTPGGTATTGAIAAAAAPSTPPAGGPAALADFGQAESGSSAGTARSPAPAAAAVAEGEAAGQQGQQTQAPGSKPATPAAQGEAPAPAPGAKPSSAAERAAALYASTGMRNPWEAAPPGAEGDAGKGAENEAPAGPRYQQPTHVMPKQPLQEYTNADVEHIGQVFSTGTALGRGIRSLPDALSTDFRQRLYDEILEAGRRERSGQARGPSTVSTSLPLAPGQRQVPKVHPYSGTFTAYEYMPSEYDRKTIIAKFERLKNKLQQVTPSDFVVKAPPQGPRGAPAFSEFEYDSEPISNVDLVRSAGEHAARAGVLSGPFLAGGKIDASVNLRGLADECMLALCRQLSKDWPLAFLQVFEDSSGAVVVCFDKLQAVTEGDLSAYMQNMVKTGRVVAEFKLVKDAAQWGLMDEETQSAFFVFWPPWVRHRFLGVTKSQVPTAASSTFTKL